MTGERNVIHLSDEDATLFLLFRQYQDDFQSMLDSGLFNIQTGEAIVRFSNSNLMEVELTQIVYKRKLDRVIPRSTLKEKQPHQTI